MWLVKKCLVEKGSYDELLRIHWRPFLDTKVFSNQATKGTDVKFTTNLKAALRVELELKKEYTL